MAKAPNLPSTANERARVAVLTSEVLAAAGKLTALENRSNDWPVSTFHIE